MSKILPRFVSVSRNFLPHLALVSILASCGVAQAQTPPSLVPYTVKAIAGGGTAPIPSTGPCPTSGFTPTDAYGDGCLATEIQLVGPRYATVDSLGNVFFSDYTNGLIRRIDVNTGIVTAVAGGAATSPAAGACGTFVSIDARGDGCQATAVHLSHPVGLTFSNPVSLGNSLPSGDLYFGDTGYSNVRKLTATNGFIPANNTGIISLAAGSTTSTFGYTANSAAGTIVASTSSFLDAPFDVAFDGAGNLYITEEFKSAILVVNTNAAAATTVAGVSIPAGTIAKIAGALAGGVTTCPNSPATTTGCNFGLATFNSSANTSEIRNNYALAVDTTGNVYFTGEYYNFIGKVSTSDVLTQYAGIQNTPGSKLLRGTPNFGIGSPFGIAADPVGNVYFTDAFNGVIWRVDTGGTTQYVVGGGGTPCSTVVDTYGDGCPAVQATFGSSNSSGFASTSNPGIFGVNVDASSNLYVGDSITNLIREVSSGTQFGNVGETSTVTQTVDVHFVAGDMPAAIPFAITKGSANFTIGTPKCTINSDATTDCLLPVTVAPSALGAFGGTLQATSALSSASFPLTAVGIMTPITRTSIALTNAGTCTGTTAFSTSTPLTFTASIASSGSPTGTITFFANGTQIGTPQTVVNNSASLTFTFATAASYSVTATYNGDSYYNKSTSPVASTVSSASPSFTAAATTYSYPSVNAGEAALYSFTIAQTVYAGTLSFSCSGLPANSSCSFSPAAIVATGCSTVNTVALSILTQQGPIATSSIGGTGHGLWSPIGMIAGFGLALAIGVTRRRTGFRFAPLAMVLALLLATSGMMACSSPITTGSTARTPAGGPYPILVTVTGSTGITSTFGVNLTVK